MELLDELAFRIYLEIRKDSKFQRVQVIEAYKEAEQFLVTRAIYLDKLELVADESYEEYLKCLPEFKQHKWNGTKHCVRCGKYRRAWKDQNREAVRKHRHKIYRPRDDAEIT